MIITVASGKGGTGKTTVAINLALAMAPDHGATKDNLSPSSHPVFLDCDVEEPNAALFLKPIIMQQDEVGILIPEVDFDKCTACGRCAEVCAYHAIAVIGQNVLVFPALCHGCGSCTLNCPEGAIHEVLHVTGVIEQGWADHQRIERGEAEPRLPAHPDQLNRPTTGGIAFGHGILNVGEPMAVPIIRQLKQRAIPKDTADRVVILDASPGTACPVVETMREADFVLLVTEPTPFGLHDLRLTVEVARDELGLPVGVVINRDGIGDRGVEVYCAAENVPILMRIPFDRRIAEAYSEGVPLLEVLPEYRERFLSLYERIVASVAERG
jgi:MinD superfamily P-loop ATPase